MKLNRDSNQAIFNILSQLILNGTNFVLIMVFTRYLSTNDYGIVSIYQAYVLLFSVLIGLNTQGSIGPAFVHIDNAEHDNYLASSILLSLLSFVCIFIIVLVCMPALSAFMQLQPVLIILMLFHGLGNFSFQFASIQFTYARKAQYSCLLAFLVAAATIVLSLLSVNEVFGNIPQYVGRILSLASPYILCALLTISVTLTKGNALANLKKYWKFCIPICIPLVFHGLSQVVLAQTDKVMLQKLYGDRSAVGIYSFYVTFVHVLNSVYVALNNTWVPVYYAYLKENDTAILEKRAKRYVGLFSMMVVGFLLVSPEIVRLFADKAYWNGSKMIPIIALSICMTFMYSFPVNFELFNCESKMIAFGTGAAAISNIILNYLFIPNYGIYGAAFATLISYALLFVFHHFCAKKLALSEMYPISKTLFIELYISTGVAIALFYLLYTQWIIRWILAVAVGLRLVKRIVFEKSIF